MNILILGHLVLDEIHTFSGEVIESAGGITFPLSAFSAVADECDTLLPMFPYGDDAAETLRQLLSTYPNIDPGYCRRVPERNTRVRLYHDAHAGYNTQLVSSLGSISREDLRHALPHADLVYLNMMTGDDVLVEDALLLRGKGRLVYLDLHMIAYKVRDDGYREPAPSGNWRSWAQVPDVLQCNEREFNAFLAHGHDENERRRLLFDAAPDLHYLIITRGERGADIYRSVNRAVHIPAWPAERLVDTTGCGDTFGSVIALGLVHGEELETTARRAARAASFVASLPGSRGMAGLRGMISEVRS